MWLLLSLACTPPDAHKAHTSLDTQTDTGPPPLTDTGAGAASPLFRVAVLADAHVTSPTSEAADRLARAVAWVNAEAAAPSDAPLELVLVVGDIAWGEGLAPAKEQLDALRVPYVPINGDNEVQAGWEEAYAEVFAPQYASLATTLEGWEAGPVGGEDPETGRAVWLHNVAFSHRGVSFIGVDWASRVIDPLYGEMGALHDYPGGSFPFLRDSLSTRAAGAPANSITLFSHIPMHLSPGGFVSPAWEALEAACAPYDPALWADLAGHYHVTGEEPARETGSPYDLYLTDALWDDTISVRVVTYAARADGGFSPTTEVVTVE